MLPVNIHHTWYTIVYTYCNHFCILVHTDEIIYQMIVLVCADGQYIFNRKCVNCSSYCKDISSCNKLTGKCENGCIYHRTGDFCQGILFRCWKSISKGSKEICQKCVNILIQICVFTEFEWPNVLPHMLVSVYFMGFIVLHVILTITTCVYNWAILFWYICKYIYPVCPILELSSQY